MKPQTLTLLTIVTLYPLHYRVRERIFLDFDPRFIVSIPLSFKAVDCENLSNKTFWPIARKMKSPTNGGQMKYD